MEVADLEVERDAAVVVAAVRIVGRTDIIAVDVGAGIDQLRGARRGAGRIGHERRRVGADIEEVVAADRELQLIGEVVPCFEIRDADGSLVLREERRAAIRRAETMDRTVIGLPERDAELIQRPVRRQIDLLLRGAVREGEQARRSLEVALPQRVMKAVTPDCATVGSNTLPCARIASVTFDELIAPPTLLIVLVRTMRLPSAML